MLVLQTIFMLLSFINAYSKQCYWNSNNNYSYFATITPYDNVRGDIRDEAPLEGCTPVSLWALVRHGTRNPMAADIAAMKSAAWFKDLIVRNFHEGRGEMCAQVCSGIGATDITNLASRTWDDTINTPGLLANQGHQELLKLGQRVREKFSALLGKLDTFQIRPTKTQRTEKSAEAFVEGLEDPKFRIEEAIEKDDVIKPYQYCDNYQLYYKNVTELKEEVTRFSETKVFQKMLTNTRQRVGIPELTVANVTAMYNLCRFFRAFSADKRDPWCAVFRDEDLLVLEYMEDLERYYSTSFPSPFASKLGAQPLKNLYENLEASVNGSRRFTGYFSHDTMLSMTFTALGLFHDYPQISGYELIRERKYKSSLITPFASNLIVILNKCLTNKTNDMDSHRVQVFINEHLVPLCRARFCAWTEFKEKLLPLRNRNLDFCEVMRSIKKT